MAFNPRAEVVINKPIGEVYSYVCNFDNWPYFTKTISVQKKFGTGEVGSKYEIVTSGIFSKRHSLMEITQKLAHMRFSFTNKSLPYLNETVFLFEEVDNIGTKVRAYKTAKVGVLYSLLTLNVPQEREVQRELEDALRHLKIIFEA